MKTIKKTNSGKNELRLVDMGKAFVGLAVSANDKIVAHVEGSDADDVWRRLHDEAAKSGAAYIGFEGARNRFLHFFPNGFRSAGFVSQERQYKLNAKAKLEQSAPLEKAATGTGLGPDILRAYQTNMLSQHELMRLRDLLHGKDADAFVQMAAAFAKGDMSVLSTLSKLLKPYECAKWTVVTYPAFLWLPEKNMFLKPEATKDFAERVGHQFAAHYNSGLNPHVYDSLLELAARTEAELSDLQPRDRIDIQSFIWVVGDYQEGEHGPYF